METLRERHLLARQILLLSGECVGGLLQTMRHVQVCGVMESKEPSIKTDWTTGICTTRPGATSMVWWVAAEAAGGKISTEISFQRNPREAN